MPPKLVLASADRPTAIFAANDLMAIGVMQALRERGLDIPHDIAVVGFDDISAARLVTPSADHGGAVPGPDGRHGG